MSKRQLPPEKLQQIQEFASQWGQIVARRALEAVAPGVILNLAEMEQVAAAAARGLTEGTISTLLEQQDQALDPQQPCPDCGTLCDVKHQQRPLAVQGGQVNLNEPVCHCSRCRRDFFPPAACSGP
jgi:hypothetical protein